MAHHQEGESGEWDDPGSREVTSTLSAADEEGGRAIYVYLSPGDRLYVETAVGDEETDEKTTVEVEEDGEGHRKWRVVLGVWDHLQTGRPKFPDPPT